MAAPFRKRRNSMGAVIFFHIPFVSREQGKLSKKFFTRIIGNFVNAEIAIWRDDYHIGH